METKPRNKAVLLLLALPYLAVLWVPSYNKLEPAWFGFPFFYWYQLAWVVLCSALVGIVFKVTRAEVINKDGK